MFAVIFSDLRKSKLPRGEFWHVGGFFSTRTEILEELSKRPILCSNKEFVFRV